jgi:shikimate kinase
MARVVVLLGPPGSGKSTIGEALASAGLRWRDWEAELLERWGSREQFIEVKHLALPELHSDVLAWIASSEEIAVLETTGLSDAALVQAIIAAGDAFVVRLEVSEEAAMARIAQRQRGRHLTDDEEPNRRVWQAFHDVGIDSLDADLVVDTEVLSPTQIIDSVLEGLNL